MRAEKSTGPMVTVHESWGENDAELIRSVLAADGIPSHLSHFSQAAYPMSVNGMGRIEINVASKDAQRAAKLINAQTDTTEK